jgi:hypothetical protein
MLLILGYVVNSNMAQPAMAYEHWTSAKVNARSVNLNASLAYECYVYG